MTEIVKEYINSNMEFCFNQIEVESGRPLTEFEKAIVGMAFHLGMQAAQRFNEALEPK